MRVFGQIESRRALDIRAATGVSILSLNPNFQEGGVVTEGDLLVALDPADAQSAYDRARNDMTEAQAELRDAERGLVLSQSDLEGAQTQLRLRERALARQRDLKERGVGTDASIETAELNVASARQSVITRSQSLAQAEARVDQAKTRLSRQDISLAEAQRRLDDTKIYAGFSGTLSDVTLVEGGRVNAGERLAQLVDPSQLDVAFRLSTSQYARLLNDTGALRDAPVTIALDVLEFDLSTGGRISRESAVVGEGQTGRLLFASLESAAGFRPGDFVTVTVTEPSIDRVALLPASAVNGQSQVLVVGEEERLSSAEVSVVRRQGDDVIVRARLRGQRVVAERAPVLGEGIKVRVLSPSSAGTQTQAPQLLSLPTDRSARKVA